MKLSPPSVSVRVCVRDSASDWVPFRGVRRDGMRIQGRTGFSPGFLVDLEMAANLLLGDSVKRRRGEE